MEFSRSSLALLFGAILLAGVSSARADGQSPRASAGILGGLAVTGASVDSGVSPNVYSASAAASYKIGVAGEYVALPNLLSVELDVLYTSYQWEQSIIATSPSVDYTTHWLEIPIFANYTGIPNFKFGLGPVLDFGVGSVSTVNTDGTQPQSMSFNAAGFGHTSVSIAMQAGYEAPVWGAWSVSADIRYLLGLTDFSQNAPMTTKIHSFDFLVGLGYAFK
jgi:hypothetical protein